MDSHNPPVLRRLTPLNYRSYLLETTRRHLEAVEAEGAAPLTVTGYRNRQNLKAWRERYQRAGGQQ